MSAAISYEQSDPSYRSDPAFAQSHVKHILKSPAHYLAATKRRFAPTLSMQIGSALHCLVLEGKEQFDRDFILKPDGINLATKEGKDWKAEAGKKTVLSRSDQYASWDAVHGMAESLQRLEWFNPSQADYRKYNELSLYWTADGVACKARLDRLVLEKDRALVLDLKTTDSIDSKKFLSKVLGDMNYLFQSAWYTEATEAAFKVPASFIFIGIERTPPYATRVFEVSSEMLAEGRRQTCRARQLLLDCMSTNNWGPPPIEYETMELPIWFQSPVEPMVADQSDYLDSVFDLP